MQVSDCPLTKLRHGMVLAVEMVKNCEGKVITMTVSSVAGVGFEKN